MRATARDPAWSYLLTAAFTCCALALRARGMGDGLYHDEFYTLVEVDGRSFVGVLRTVAHGIPGVPDENAPPLYYVLAMLSSKLGEPTAWIRLPSVLLGTATVPLVFLLGVRTVGRPAGVVAAGIVALSPFAIFYGTEARPYATLMFLSTASALLLLAATETDRAAWWVAFGVSVAAVLYTHYTGVFVIGAEGIWALWFHRRRWRRIVAVYLAVAAACAIWLPYLHGNPADFEALARLLGITHWDALLIWIAGIQEVPVDEVPGTVALALLGAGVVLGALGRARSYARAPTAERGEPLAPRLLVLMLALAAPVGALLYGVVSIDLFLFPRNMIASFPFVALALGWVLTPSERAVTAAAVALAGAAFAIAAVKTLEPRFQRPDFPAVADLVDTDARTGDRVVYSGAAFTPFVLADALAYYYEDRHPQVIASQLPSSAVRADTRQASLADAFARRGGLPRRVFLVQFGDAGAPASMPGWVARRPRTFAGIAPLTVVEYRPGATP